MNAMPAPAALAALIEIGRYPFTRMLTSRFGDMDADGFISETSLARYVEQARSLVLTEVMSSCGLDLRHGPLGMLVARVTIECVRHVVPEAEITLAAGVAGIGHTSVNLRVGVFSHGGCVAFADNTMVFIARGSGRPTRPPEPLLQRLQAWMMKP